MAPRFEYGTAVRVVRNIRNDGTFPGEPTGRVLVRCGTVGHVCNVGTFLQDQLIYSVHFLGTGRVVGCRDQELISADAPWVPSHFAVRDRVRTRLALSVGGRIAVEAGTCGDIVEVLRDSERGVAYHVRFSDRVLVVPEATLCAEPGDVDE